MTTSDLPSVSETHIGVNLRPQVRVIELTGMALGRQFARDSMATRCGHVSPDNDNRLAIAWRSQREADSKRAVQRFTFCFPGEFFPCTLGRDFKSRSAEPL